MELGLSELSLNSFYLSDLEQYFRIMDELNQSIMMPGRRVLLENCKEALQVILQDMYELPDWR